ncbi:SusC/RagA family TonB-linked outer membrane protein, partial [uncultured Draconibacterium sp.]|uniref:SusC/RagA family TonB-linked outer membrane protein n=1 Tax=uncultured Draconibacterium sp. TaxID=1573823 RepID=UPI0025FC4DC8
MRIIRKNLKVVLFLVALLSFSISYAQVKTVTGNVSDAGNGEPLPGVTIVVKGTTQGTITDFDGNYSINVEEGVILLFSYIGYNPQEVTVSASNQLNIQLEQSMENLDEVVVIGYGQVKKEDATGSVTAVRAEDFNKGNITSPQDLLVGKASGVVITSSGGAPGSGSQIRIRGGSSLNASNDPLIIIDGIPISNNDVSGGSNFLAFVNPNDIESMSVLKDASATAIYGSRASNGVIIITTKKGKAGRPTQINADVKTSVSTPIKFVDVYSGDEVRQIAHSKPELYAPESYDMLWSENTNWQDEIFRTSVSQESNLSISGSIKDVPYRASVGLNNQNGILKNTSMKRLTGSLSVDPILLDGDLRVNLNLKGMTTSNNFGDTGAIGSAISMDPTKPVNDASQTGSGGYFQWVNYGASLGTANPVEQLMAVDNKSDVNRIVANAQFDYKIPFVPGLKANLNLASDYSKGEGYNNRPTTSPQTLTDNRNGRLNDYDATHKNNLLEFYLNYNRDLESINSRIDATAGYSWQHFEREENSFTTSAGDDNQNDVTTASFTENYLVSFFGRLNYTLAEKYLLTFTLRNDGSSRFIDDNKWGLFPSAALAWKISDESFLKDSKTVSDLKLRLGWGITGQQDIGNDYPAQATYVQASEGSYYQIGGVFIPTLRPSAYDPDIKWEETTTYNAGLDFGFFDNQLSGSLDVYYRETKDLLNTVTIPTGSNFSNTLLTNVGSLENKGVELSLDWRAISQKDMSLNVGFNVSYNDNEITKLNFNDDPNYKVLYGGGMTGTIQVTTIGYPGYSFYLNQQVYYPNGTPVEGMYVDLSGEGGTVNGDNDDKYIYHNPVADVLMGLSAS